MKWPELTVEVSAGDLQTAEDIADMASPRGIYVEDYSDLEKGAAKTARIDSIDVELLKKDRNTAFVHIYFENGEERRVAAAYLKERLAAGNIGFKISESEVSESDWAENWKRYFKPTEIGERLAVCPTWEDYRNRENRTVLKIDPGAAFGTGTHATTFLCLEMMQKFIAGGEDVLDVGCGSGILGIAAALLGAKSVTGVDIDETAVRVANENAALNGVGDRAVFRVGNLADGINGKFDIILANIVADTVIDLLKTAKSRLKPGGTALCSGIIDGRAEEVSAAAAAAGFTRVGAREKDGWRAMTFKTER